MSSIKVKLDMSKQQLSKLKSAKKNSKAVAIRFSNSQIFKESGHEIEVSPEQYKNCCQHPSQKQNEDVYYHFQQIKSNQAGFLVC